MVNRASTPQAQLMASLASTEEWRQAVGTAAGWGSAQQLDPTGAAAEVRRLRAAAEKVQGQQAEPGPVNVQKEAAKQLQLAQRNLENVMLRRQAHNAQRYAFPSTAQVSPALSRTINDVLFTLQP